METDIKIKYGGTTITRGDFVLVVDGEGLFPMFYIGRGPTGTWQFYTMYALDFYYRKYMVNDIIQKPKKVYYASMYDTKMIKVEREVLSDRKEYESYDNAIKALKLLNVI